MEKNIVKLKEKGNEYFKKNDFKKAIEAYSEAIKYSKDNATLLSNRSAAYCQVNEYVLAEADGYAALHANRINPLLPANKIYSRIATALQFQKRYSDAKLAFELHYRFLMRAAQAMVLGIQCQRVFIINQVQVKNYPLVTQMSSELQKVFEDHPRNDWISHIDVFVQRIESMFPLSGGLFLSRIFALSRQKSH